PALTHRFHTLVLFWIDSACDNLAATFSPELADITIYVIDVAAGDKIPRKGGPGITRSDLLVLNKIDLAPFVGASLEVMDRDARKMRGQRPFVFTNMRSGEGLDSAVDFIERAGGPRSAASSTSGHSCRSSTDSRISTAISSPGGATFTPIRRSSTTCTG